MIDPAGVLDRDLDSWVAQRDNDLGAVRDRAVARAAGNGPEYDDSDVPSPADVPPHMMDVGVSMMEEKRLAYKKAQAAIQRARKRYDLAIARWNEARAIWKWACQEFYPEAGPTPKEAPAPIELAVPWDFGLLRCSEDN